MAQVKLSVGGRVYELACREGEEAHYEALAARLDEKAEAVKRAVGGVSEARLLLLTALLLADDIHQAGPNAAPAPPPEPAIDPQMVSLLHAFADRLESLGTKLEKAAPAS